MKESDKKAVLWRNAVGQLNNARTRLTDIENEHKALPKAMRANLQYLIADASEAVREAETTVENAKQDYELALIEEKG